MLKEGTNTGPGRIESKVTDVNNVVTDRENGIARCKYYI